MLFCFISATYSPEPQLAVSLAKARSVAARCALGHSLSAIYITLRPLYIDLVFIFILLIFILIHYL